MAQTLRRLAEEGRDAFYRGDIAHTIDDFMRQHGGFLAYQDLATHRSEWVEPVSCNDRGLDVWELPPNGQGIAALQILNMLSGFDLRSAGFGSPLHLHSFVEAKKLAFEDRARFYADPAFHKLPVAELISSEYAERRRIRLLAAVQPSAAAKSARHSGERPSLCVASPQRHALAAARLSRSAQ